MYSLWQKICYVLLFSKNSIAQDVLPTPKKLEPYFTDLLRCVSTSYSSRRGAGKLRHLGSGGAFRWYFVVVCYLFFCSFVPPSRITPFYFKCRRLPQHKSTLPFPHSTQPAEGKKFIPFTSRYQRRETLTHNLAYSPETLHDICRYKRCRHSKAPGTR